MARKLRGKEEYFSSKVLRLSKEKSLEAPKEVLG